MFDFFNSFFHGYKIPHKLHWDASYEQIIQAQRSITDLYVQNWLHHSFGHWYWWFLLFWSTFPLFVWWKYADRQRFLEVSFFGMMISISAGILDSVGVYTLAWSYPYGFAPVPPNFFPIDYVTLPVIFLLIYQKYPGWKKFIIAATVVSAFLSLILDPIMVWLNLYQPFFWQYIYSIPVFVFMVGFCKLVTMIITGQDIKYGGSSHGKKAA